MTGRQAIEDLLEELYAARVRGNLDAVVRLFAANATFQVAGTDDASPMPILVKGNAGIRDLMPALPLTKIGIGLASSVPATWNVALAANSLTTASRLPRTRAAYS